MTGFKITGGKGFHITFGNGWTISIQFGPGNYGDNYNADYSDYGRSNKDWQSSQAEVAAWNSKKEWFDFDAGKLCESKSNAVVGYKDVDQVLGMINLIASQQP